MEGQQMSDLTSARYHIDRAFRYLDNARAELNETALTHGSLDLLRRTAQVHAKTTGLMLSTLLDGIDEAIGKENNTTTTPQGAEMTRGDTSRHGMTR